MILFVELLALCIGLTVFTMQHKFRQKISLVGSKVVYWCTLLFVSIIFNSILFAMYPESYNIASYLNFSTLLALLGIIVGCLMVQIIAPSKPFKRWMKKFNKQKGNEESTEEVIKIKEQSNYLKELHFETFLETLCWLAIVFTVALEIFMNLLRMVFQTETIDVSLSKMVCLMMMMTVPVIVRQIVFYLYSIRGMKEEQDLSEVEVKFYHKLKKNNSKL